MGTKLLLDEWVKHGPSSWSGTQWSGHTPAKVVNGLHSGLHLVKGIHCRFRTITLTRPWMFRSRPCKEGKSLHWIKKYNGKGSGT
eukprot:1139918-Pelagomonas_calceolata.AAC.2